MGPDILAGFLQP